MNGCSKTKLYYHVLQKKLVMDKNRFQSTHIHVMHTTLNNIQDVPFFKKQLSTLEDFLEIGSRIPVLAQIN